MTSHSQCREDLAWPAPTDKERLEQAEMVLQMLAREWAAAEACGGGA